MAKYTEEQLREARNEGIGIGIVIGLFSFLLKNPKILIPLIIIVCIYSCYSRSNKKNNVQGQRPQSIEQKVETSN